MSAFMLYSNEMRQKVKEENPDATFGDIAKIIGAQYKQLSAEERAKFEEKASKDKKRYAQESK
jgi:HMG (high mobility group) box